MKFIIFTLLINIYSVALADWTPPNNPDPSEILNEAREDAQHGNYENALLKHLWFHNNALNYDRSFYGVRLSFALSDWYELGKKYPPALQALKEARDLAEKYVHDGTNYYASFHDYKSINKELGEQEKTIQLFRWLDTNHPAHAQKVYRIAQPTLIKAKEYKLCGKYIDPEISYSRYIRHFRAGLQFSKKSSCRKKAEHFAYTSFSNNVSILVALLVISNRSSEAKEISKKAILEWDDEKFSSMLSSALKGKVPNPWP